jgi:hypothetical protein
LKSIVRTLPICSQPVGLGGNLAMIFCFSIRKIIA